MNRRVSVSLASVALVVIFASSVAPNVEGVDNGDDPIAVTANENGRGKGGGNKFFRALKGPFSAIGRVFGGGKKGGVKFERLSEKDVKKFESVPLLRTTDASTPAPPPSVEQVDTVEGLISGGRSALARGAVNDAVGMLTRAVSLGPERGEAHHLLGVAYFHKGFPEQSKISFEHALRFGGGNA